MRIIIFLAMMFALFAAGCGGNILPQNDKTIAQPPIREPIVEVYDLIDEIDHIQADKMRSGVILIAFAHHTKAGYGNGKLVALNDGKPLGGILRFEFRVIPPIAETPALIKTNENPFIAGVPISNKILKNLKKIEVMGAKNTRIIKL